MFHNKIISYDKKYESSHIFNEFDEESQFRIPLVSEVNSNARVLARNKANKYFERIKIRGLTELENSDLHLWDPFNESGFTERVKKNNSFFKNAS